MKAHNDKAVLKKEVSRRILQIGRDPLTFIQTDLEDCADAFVAAAKNSSMTGQNIQIGKITSFST